MPLRGDGAHVDLDLTEVGDYVGLVAALDHVHAQRRLTKQVTLTEREGVLFQTWDEPRHVADSVHSQPGHGPVCCLSQCPNAHPQHSLLADEHVEVGGLRHDQIAGVLERAPIAHCQGAYHAGLFAAGSCQDNICCGTEPRSSQSGHCADDRSNPAFHIAGTSPKDTSVNQLSFEGRMLPRLAPRWHDVEVTGKYQV